MEALVIVAIAVVVWLVLARLFVGPFMEAGAADRAMEERERLAARAAEKRKREHDGDDESERAAASTPRIGSSKRAL